MERDELADDRMAFMAGEVGCVVFELIYNGIEINKENIVGFLEGKRKAVGNVMHKGLLRDAAEMVRKGGERAIKTRLGGRVGWVILYVSGVFWQHLLECFHTHVYPLAFYRWLFLFYGLPTNPVWGLALYVMRRKVLKLSYMIEYHQCAQRGMALRFVEVDQE